MSFSMTISKNTILFGACAGSFLGGLVSPLLFPNSTLGMDVLIWCLFSSAGIGVQVLSKLLWRNLTQPQSSIIR